MFMELHEAGNIKFTLPKTEIPKWVEHQRIGTSISFWFRYKISALVLCFMLSPYDPLGALFVEYIYMDLFINDEYVNYLQLTSNHTTLIGLRANISAQNLDELPCGNAWYHVKLKCKPSRIIVECGIHVIKQGCSPGDIRFTNPCKKRKSEDDLNILNISKKSKFMDIDVSETIMEQQEQRISCLSQIWHCVWTCFPFLLRQ
ncbi:hypothetical protein RJT34_26446 [Clitoria ternatea]|uniref:Uncharacterized protein n=1 Tax=Clitoria ternatea TaxID=43366 RepID=A0AAN9IBK4_CLITE